MCKQTPNLSLPFISEKQELLHVCALYMLLRFVYVFHMFVFCCDFSSLGFFVCRFCFCFDVMFFPREWRDLRVPKILAFRSRKVTRSSWLQRRKVNVGSVLVFSCPDLITF